MGLEAIRRPFADEWAPTDENANPVSRCEITHQLAVSASGSTWIRSQTAGAMPQLEGHVLPIVKHVFSKLFADLAR